MKLERLGEFKILTLRETVPPSALSNGDTPELIAEYYRNQIETALRYISGGQRVHGQFDRRLRDINSLDDLVSDSTFG